MTRYVAGNRGTRPGLDRAGTADGATSPLPGDDVVPGTAQITGDPIRLIK